MTKAFYDRLRLGVGLSGYSTYRAFEFDGSAALPALNRLVLSDLSRLPIGRVMATYLLKEDAGLLADILIWNRGGQFFVLAEAAQPESLVSWFAENAHGAAVRDLSGETEFIGVDGPFAWELLKEMVGVRILGLRYLETMADQKLSGIPVDIIRAGKTGEFGYILKVNRQDASALRDRLLEAGRPMHVAQCDDASIDLCKLENRFTNVYKEGSAASNVLELNCRIQVSQDKGEYLGQAAIEKAMAEGGIRRLIGLTVHGGDVPAEKGAVTQAGQSIGTVVSSGFSWTLNTPIALALISADYAYVGCTYDLEGGAQATTVSAPFVLNKSILIRPQEDSFASAAWSFKP